MHFIYKWRKKWRFSHHHSRRHPASITPAGSEPQCNAHAGMPPPGRDPSPRAPAPASASACCRSRSACAASRSQRSDPCKTPLRCRRSRCSAAAPGPRCPAETSLVFNFSQCLFQACLGKRSTFQCKMVSQNRHVCPHRQHVHLRQPTHLKLLALVARRCGVRMRRPPRRGDRRRGRHPQRCVRSCSERNSAVINRSK
jgi:hypothetical protein